MTEIDIDSSGPSPLLQGREKEPRRLSRARFDLADSLDILGKFFGSSRYTKRALHGSGLDQSRPDQFYLSDNGWWLGKIVELTHVSNQTHSDHNLVLLQIHLLIPSPSDVHL